MSALFVGIDVSTTASKVLVINEAGEVIASSTHGHTLSTPRPLWSEQDPEEWWAATVQGLREATAQVPANAIAAIGLTGQMHGLTLMGDAGDVLRPAILWNDQRSAPQCDAITEKVGAEWLYQHIGSRMLSGFTAPKLVWVREHEPEVFSRVKHILLPKDYVRYRLSGAYVTDVADGSGIALMDVAKRQWSEALLSTLEIPRAWLPELCESTEISAYVSERAAQETGLVAGTPIVGGAGDQPAGGVGSGIVQPGTISLAIGTSGVAFAFNETYMPDPQGRLHTFCHAIPGTWFSMGVMLSAAGGLRWLRDAVAPDASYADLSERAARVPHGANGLVFAPYLSGERHPYADAMARGAFVGLTLRHELGHMVRAVMEGVAFGMRDLFELIAARGARPTSAVVSGGAVNSPVWRQLLADVLGIPLQTVNSSEGAAFGAAVLAAVGVGAWPTVADACAQLIRRETTIVPNPDGVQAYSALYPVYRALYPTLREVNTQLSQFDDDSQRI